MKTRSLLLSCVLAVPALHAAEPKAAPAIISTEIGGKDLQFMLAASNAGIVQTNLGELAKKRAQSDAVKLLGEAVATGHAATKTELQILASKKGVAVSNTPNREQIALVDTILKLDGEKFEKACMTEIVRLQQMEVADFESAAESSDPDVKAFAVKFLPQLREQFLLAKKIGAMAARPSPTAAPAFRATAPNRDRK